MNQEQIEQEFKDWVALLERTGNKDLLNDPYNIWLEAWTVATILANEKKTQN